MKLKKYSSHLISGKNTKAEHFRTLQLIPRATNVRKVQSQLQQYLKVE